MIGQKLGSFTIESKIGSGAMGVVYRASQEPTGRPAALKVITGEYATKGNAARRFRREADILQQFRHPNIVRFFAVGRSQGTLYFAMEFVEGGTLENLLERREFLPWREAVELSIQICEALHYAHQHGVVHRDLKPSNLLISASGQVKLTDFGIAKDLDATALTATGRTLGTAAYMAPEQIRGTPEVSHKTDLYALGCVLYQMLTGHPPFEGKSAVALMHSHLNDPPPRPSARNPEMPVALDKLVVALMGKESSDRPWDAQAAAQALIELRDKAARGEPVAMVFPASGGPPTRLGASIDNSSFGATATRVRKTGKKGKKRKADTADAPARGRLVETLGLVAALVAVACLIVYLMLPPGPDDLYRQAVRGMASKERSVRNRTLEEYVKPLDERFPGHKYTTQTRRWRDLVLLEDASRRGKILQSALGGEPQGDAEALYLRVVKANASDQEAGRDDLALARWRAMADALKDRPDDRKWLLLAQKEADDLRKVMDDRRSTATAFLTQADAAEAAGRASEALGLRREVLLRYGGYADLGDLLARARAGLPADAATGP